MRQGVPRIDDRTRPPLDVALIAWWHGERKDCPTGSERRQCQLRFCKCPSERLSLDSGEGRLDWQDGMCPAHHSPSFVI